MQEQFKYTTNYNRVVERRYTNWRYVPDHTDTILLKNNSIRSESCSGTRVIRKEEGKIAEIFTLVIKGTMEENWYSTSNVGKEYIEITERELDDILNGEKSNNLVQEGKETDLLFRL